MKIVKTDDEKGGVDDESRGFDIEKRRADIERRGSADEFFRADDEQDGFAVENGAGRDE